MTMTATTNDNVFAHINKVVRCTQNAIMGFNHEVPMPVIAGGAIRDMVLDKTPKDYDIFFFVGSRFTDPEFYEIAEEIADNLTCFKSVEQVVLSQCYEKSSSDFDINHQGVIKVKCVDGPDIDLVFTRRANALELMAYFDISINRCYMTVNEEFLFSKSNTLHVFDFDTVELRNADGYNLSYLSRPKTQTVVPDKVINRLYKFVTIAKENNLQVGPILHTIVSETEALLNH